MSHKVIIADDEPLVRERLCALLSTYKEMEICASCQDGKETIEMINIHQPDILFLDIKMPKSDGFKVLETISNENCLVIFVTAYEQYAVKAFEYEAFDYLVKPITSIRFSRAIDRILKTFSKSDATNDSSLLIKNNGSHIRVKCRDISHLEADDNYVKVYSGEKCYKKRATLNNMVKQLQKDDFLRVHRSYAINTRYVQSLVRIYKGDYLIRLSNGKVIPTSGTYREEVRQLLEKGI